MNLRPCECGGTIYTYLEELCKSCFRRKNWALRPYKYVRHNTTYDTRLPGMNKLLDEVEE